MSHSYPEFGRSLVILHVDDDPMNLRVVEEILGAFGHRSVRCTSGAEALERLADQTFDVVLMDIHMPEMGGIEALQKVRALPGPGAETPVIALTADVVSRRPDDYLTLGFQGFVAKPILVSGLLQAIKTAIDPQPSSRSPRLRLVG